MGPRPLGAPPGGCPIAAAPDGEAEPRDPQFAVVLPRPRGAERGDGETPVHWARGADSRVDPEPDPGALLPRLALETRLRRSGSAGPGDAPRERWEPEDEAEAALERDLELSLGPGLEMPALGARRSRGEGLEDTEDLARLQ